MMNIETINALTSRVLMAQDSATTITKLTDEFPSMTMADSYDIQDELCRRWVARGDRITGMKAGLTSRAKMLQMGVDEPSFGFLTSAMACPESGKIQIDELVHPRVEAEIGFVLKREIGGDHLSIDDVMAATDFVIPAVEIIDSRYEKFKFDLISVIADNGSSSRYVTGGRPMDPRNLDLCSIGVVIECNGDIEELGASAAVLDHPANSIIMLAAHLHSRGARLPAGQLILTGGITAAVAVQKGDVINARFQNMGSVSFRFV
ncbi:2-oxo-3-hexenedioate decarboxylase [Zhongshania sp. BJYM1]|uniref:2-oxo-3-hexenedioate decarboxylase n=1 Tax=Zhongshania aquatica TaxID=2965069 RepID=UPI0022B529AA|nr:2-oxo-3-hexenedioate decarboxylase [Marortus sp. BJYM1]